ncbi:SUN domain-containing protein 1-like isoform X2 [Anoplopoma fimbria]|uniref:SUN domain-containing protein 1-like isoform X2 n=1 Tax=Anoplopoma fimbria TaxID=229290 RepID=UPI0023EB4F96|nr:SUN domain-containing protein 1-like isoform X2 [Anoplopoma fimbria]
MSRRSLRLEDGLLDRSLPHSSASFSVGGPSWRSNRSLKSRRSQQHSASCSESLLLDTPRRATGPSLLSSSVHSVASDASLLSSLLDESSVHESTLVDTFWESTVLADRTLVSEVRCPKHLVPTLNRVHCKDCEHQTVDTYRSASKYTSSSEPETSTIYCRDRSRKSKTDVLQLWFLSVLLCVRIAATGCVCALTHTWQVCRDVFSQINTQTESRHGAGSGLCGVMDLRGTNQKELRPSGSLCDDCEEKQRSSSSSSLWSSVASCLLGLMWSAAVVTASGLCQLTHSAASAVWPLTKKMFSSSLSAGRSAGEAAGDVYRRINRRLRHMTSSFLPTWFPLRLLLVLLLLLLLFSLCWFGPVALHSVLPAISITDWGTLVSDPPGLSSVSRFLSFQSRPAEGTVEESREVQPPDSPPPAGGEEEELAADESIRLLRLEESLAALWEHVEAGGQRAEQRHTEFLRLYADLQQQHQLVSDQSHGEEAEPWRRDQQLELERQLEQLSRRLDEDRQKTEKSLQQNALQQQSQTSRLDQLELHLQTLAARSEEVQRRREAAATLSPPSSSSSTLLATVGGGVDRQSHDALLAEVSRLEVALEVVRRDVDGLSGCQDGCRQLDSIQQTISALVSTRVHEEVRVLVYGNQLTVGGGATGDGAGLPESLIQWLSQRYVSAADLQEALSSLELSILRNIGLQLEQHRGEETGREAVLHATGDSMTQEDVHEIVKNALRLFSQDQTGMADFALESGGGSILSTRCSETYETKAALLSLFGLPLWYFSQSPRAVIQPDLHPGNCWAFRGSTGFLVIRLSMRILPTAFSLEHISRTLAPSGTLLSAPRDFTVYGLEDEGQERGKLLGSYTYDEDGEALQTYPVTEENDAAFQIIEVQVLSNWGHLEYTCMYRFRVHGMPRDA